MNLGIKCIPRFDVNVTKKTAIEENRGDDIMKKCWN